MEGWTGGCKTSIDPNLKAQKDFRIILKVIGTWVGGP
jgi:hypothetical protein